MRRLNTAGFALIAVALMLSAASKTNAGLISEKQELSMGKQASRQIESQYKVSKDQQMNDLVRGIGVKLASVCSRPKIDWTFKVLDTKEVNAVSVPGYVYVNSGLIDFAGGDKDQLAAVIGHEIGHTCGHHAVKQAEKSMIGGTLLSIVFQKGGGDVANIFANLALLGYSRKDEYQADKLGLSYSYKAGYDPKGMVRFFEHLQAKEGGGSSGLGTYFKTHPPTSERIKRVKEQIATLK
jgi:beta-barrel assembly-enhancing protease